MSAISHETTLNLRVQTRNTYLLFEYLHQYQKIKMIAYIWNIISYYVTENKIYIHNINYVAAKEKFMLEIFLNQSYYFNFIAKVNEKNKRYVFFS